MFPDWMQSNCPGSLGHGNARTGLDGGFGASIDVFISFFRFISLFPIFP
jgi:hypothetical protein